MLRTYRLQLARKKSLFCLPPCKHQNIHLQLDIRTEPRDGFSNVLASRLSLALLSCLKSLLFLAFLAKKRNFQEKILFSKKSSSFKLWLDPKYYQNRHKWGGLRRFGKMVFVFLDDQVLQARDQIFKIDFLSKLHISLPSVYLSSPIPSFSTCKTSERCCPGVASNWTYLLNIWLEH